MSDLFMLMVLVMQLAATYRDYDGGRYYWAFFDFMLFPVGVCRFFYLDLR